MVGEETCITDDGGLVRRPSPLDGMRELALPLRTGEAFLEAFRGGWVMLQEIGFVRLIGGGDSRNKETACREN